MRFLYQSVSTARQYHEQAGLGMQLGTLLPLPISLYYTWNMFVMV